MSTAPGAFHLDPEHSLGLFSSPSPTTPTSPASPGSGHGLVYENLPESEPRKLVGMSGRPGSHDAPRSQTAPRPSRGAYENVGQREDRKSRVNKEEVNLSRDTGMFHFSLEGSESPDTTTSQNQISTEVEVHNRRNQSMGTPSPGPSTGEGEESVEEMFASVISVAIEEEERRERESTLTREEEEESSFTTARGPDTVGHENPAYNGGETDTPPHYRIPTNYHPQDSLKPTNNNSPPKAVVQPRVHGNNNNAPHVVNVMIEDTLPRNKGASTYENVNDNSPGRRCTPSAITSMDDVPTRIDSLTVDDVTTCLTLLNMENHVAHFRKRQVDGTLLSSMKENVLINEFTLTPFNASKLMRFIRGWRPKFT